MVRDITDVAVDIAARRFAESRKKKIEIEADDLAPLSADGPVDLEDVIEGFVRAHRAGKMAPAGDQTAQVNLPPVSDELAARIKSETGVDVAGLRHSIDTSQIDHAFSRHGPGNEKDRDQEPISADAIGAYLDVVENPDRIIGPRKKGGGVTITFEKRVDGLTVVVEQVRTKAKSGKTPTLAFFDMWVKRVAK